MLTFNRAAYIGAAVESVLTQTHEDFELIILDDGSTDDTQKILATYTDPRITVIRHETNKGLHARRKESLQYATGIYTAVLDSDDVWCSEDKLKLQVTYMEDNPDTCLVGTFLTHVDAHGTKIGSNEYCIDDTDIRNVILRRNQFAHSSVLIRTAVLTQIKGYQDTVLAEDLDVFLQLGTLGTFANIPQYMTAYRFHPDSFNHQRLKMAKAVLGIIKRYKHQYPNYYQGLGRAYLRIVLIMIRSLVRPVSGATAKRR